MLNICYKQKLITQQFVHTGLQKKNFKKEIILKKLWKNDDEEDAFNVAAGQLTKKNHLMLLKEKC